MVQRVIVPYPHGLKPLLPRTGPLSGAAGLDRDWATVPGRHRPTTPWCLRPGASLCGPSVNVRLATVANGDVGTLNSGAGIHSGRDLGISVRWLRDNEPSQENLKFAMAIARQVRYDV